MQFVSSLIASLAWPVAAVAIVFLFRESLASRFASLLSLTLPGGVEAKFSEKLTSVEQAVTDAAEMNSAEPQHGVELAPDIHAAQPEHAYPPMQAGFVSPPPDSRALKANPTGVVMEGWKLLEAALRAMHLKYLGPTARELHSDVILKELSQREFLSKDEVKTLKNMFGMRNLAAHSTEPISPESASAFADLAERLAHTIANRGPATPP